MQENIEKLYNIVFNKKEVKKIMAEDFSVSMAAVNHWISNGMPEKYQERAFDILCNFTDNEIEHALKIREEAIEHAQKIREEASQSIPESGSRHE